MNWLKKIFSYKAVLPVLLFAVVVTVFYFTLSMEMKPPVITDISPRIVDFGDQYGFSTDQDELQELTIIGENFGSSQGGNKIIVAGFVPTKRSILEWSDTKIRFAFSREINSGLVFVDVDNRKSNGVLFTNGRQLPVIVNGPSNPGMPFIEELTPERGGVGTYVTLKGMNFGLNRGTSKVAFNWIYGDKIKSKDEDPFVYVHEKDYAVWSEREIAIYVPDGVTSGNIFIQTDKGRSNTVFFELTQQAGKKIITAKKTFAINYAVTIKDIEATDSSNLYLWIPRVFDDSIQRNIQLVSKEPEPLFENYNGILLYHLENIGRFRERKVYQNFIFDRYGVSTEVKLANVPYKYNTKRELYKTYTTVTPNIPADEANIRFNTSLAVGRERNPYSKALKIYKYIIAALSYDKTYNDTDLLKTLTVTKKTDSWGYAHIFCAFARNAGIPARPVAGFIVTKSSDFVNERSYEVYRHFWAEFYIENLGWIPVDPVLGEGARFGDFPNEANPMDFYFGNIDNQHLVFSRGSLDIKSMDPLGTIVSKTKMYSIQGGHEEVAGDVQSYTSIWSDIEVTGMY